MYRATRGATGLRHSVIVCRLRTTAAVALALFFRPVWAQTQTDPHRSLAQADEGRVRLPEGPIEFRCDKLEVYSKPVHKQICRGHAVVRRGELLLCCQTLIAESDAHWALQNMICAGDVRLRRTNQTIWADLGRYTIVAGQIVLTGSPLLQRDGSQLVGEQIVVALDQQNAKVLRPRGQLTAGSSPGALPPGPTPGALPNILPNVCPIAARPAATP